MKIVASILTLLICTLAFGQDTEIDKLINNGDLKAALNKTNKLDETKDKYTYLGAIYLQKGQYELAKTNFNKALSMHNAEENKLSEATCYANIALAEWALGNNSKALEYHQRALKIREEEKDKAAIAASYNDIGLTYFSTDIDKALDYYEKALAIYKEIYEPNNDRIGTAHTNIGLAYLEMKLYGDATLHLEKALEIRKVNHGDDHATVAIVLNNLGQVQRAKGDDNTALEYYKRALTIFQKAYGAKHPDIASTHNLIGFVHAEQDSFLEAINSFQKAIQANSMEFSSTDMYSLPATDDYYNGDIMLLSVLEKARVLEAYHFGKTLKPIDLKAAHQHVGFCDKLIDELRQQKTSEADKINLGNTATEVYELGIALSNTLAELSWKKKGYYEMAFYYAEKSKAAVLLDAIADTNAKSYANIPDDKIALEQALKTEIAFYQQKLAAKPAKELEDTYRHELFTLNNEYQKFIDDLEANYGDYYQLKYNIGLPPVEKVQELIPENTALLSYFITNSSEEIYVFSITKKRLKVKKVNAGRDINRLISGYRNSIYYNFEETYLNTAHELYTMLIPRLPSSINHFIIVPSGKLGIMPFEALLTHSAKQESDFESLPYLVNKYSVSLQYSTALLTTSAREMKTEESICLIAPIEFTKHELPKLPATAKEVNEIAHLFQTSHLESAAFTEGMATEVVVKSNDISKSKYLHFATHGIVDEENPELSQVYLASSEGEDGNLYSGEIYNLTLQADLVTLSACQTGLGKIHKGEGIVGLSRALIYSGANNLVVSLWSVADQSTSQLMIDFYSGILKRNESYGKALQSAKLKMIQSDKFSAPYYWAPFTLIGQ